MYANGVSHVVVDNDLQGVHVALEWLSYVPISRLGL
jgi:acetyl-CoA carboxylase carboxyltransferase component